MYILYMTIIYSIYITSVMHIYIYITYITIYTYICIKMGGNEAMRGECLKIQKMIKIISSA